MEEEERNGGERISLPRSSVTETEKRARELELGRLTCGEGEVSESSRRRSKTPLSNKHRSDERVAFKCMDQLACRERGGGRSTQRRGGEEKEEDELSETERDVKLTRVMKPQDLVIALNDQ